MRIFVVLLLLGLSVRSVVVADIVTNTAVKDNTLYEYVPADGDKSNGAGDNIFAGITDAPVLKRRGVVAFSVANVPAGSTINSVTLRLYMNRTTSLTNRTLTLHRLTEDWGEGTSNASGQEGKGANATSGDATWRYRTNTLFWSTQGGAFNATASASATVALTNGHYNWTSAGLASDVQAWVNSTATNVGWLLKGTETTNHTAMRFTSRENSTTAQRPIVVINFTPPALSGACCFTNGDCTVLSAANCSAQGGTYQGNGTSCSPNPCPQPPPMGACCFSNATCVVTNPTDCVTLGGNYQGNNTTCTSNLCPLVLAQFVDALPIPAVATPVSNQVYVVPIRQATQQLHRDLPATTVWRYGGSYPGPTIEAISDQMTTVIWSNDLRDSFGNLRTNHFLPVDLCMMGPDTEGATPRVVPHLHGAHVQPEYDGYPEAWMLPGEGATYFYPNKQLPATLWYHDHALGITRLNVMMGLAGFYLIRDAFEQSLGLPAGEYEIGLAIQDRKFNPDGSLQYPAAWDEHFFGDVMLVNGKVWPYLDVKKGKYRFRLLNGCNARTLTLGLSNAANFQQIGTEGGLLPAPVTTNSITLSPGERVDVVMDFAGYTTGTQLILQNTAPAPFPGPAGVGVVTNVMKFVVQATSGFTGSIPGSLRPIETLSVSNSVKSRNFILRKVSDPCAGQKWAINDLGWHDITEFPVLDTTEVWSFANPSGVVHPMHMHLVMFQLLDRQACTVTGTNITLSGPVIPAPPTEAGWKDTVQCPPNMVTRVIARFDDYTGKFPYHCHILEHEDHEMMRQFQVVPPPRVTGIQPNGADIQISFSPSTNHLHSAERRDDLLTGSWSSFTNGIAGDAAIKTVTDPGAMGVTQRFYRIGVQP